MGLDAISLKMVAPHVRGARILCLGYPDMVLPEAEVEQILRVRPEVFTEFGANHKRKYRLAETRDTLLRAGAESVECIDVRPSRNCERVVNLNDPQNWAPAWDLVIDGGTIEHCFNIGQAFWNAWSAVTEGGHIVHVSPLSMVNHGFYNINPTAYVDFYQANGGSVIEICAADRKLRPLQIMQTARCAVQSEAVIYAKVRKLSDVPFGWPSQTKYRT